MILSLDEMFLDEIDLDKMALMNCPTIDMMQCTENLQPLGKGHYGVVWRAD